MTPDDLIAAFAALPEEERAAFLAGLDEHQQTVEKIPEDHWPAVAAAAEKLPEANDPGLTPHQTQHLRRLLRERNWSSLPPGEALACHLAAWKEARATE